MAIYSYDLQGKKDSFADWISNISPQDTFVVTNSKKEGTPQNRFKWQTDSLAKVVYNLKTNYDVLEGADAPDDTGRLIKLFGTNEKNGITQIFRKTFAISDSALATSVHGRQGELKYQLEKAGKELKNVMETVFLSKQVKHAPDATHPAKTDGLYAQIAAVGVDNPDLPDPTTIGFKAGDFAVHKAGELTFDNIDAIANALYMSGSEACTLIINPVNAVKLAEASVEAGKKIKQQQTFAKFKWETANPVVEGYDEMYSITDSRGCQWTVQFSRFCPVDVAYFVHPDYLTQRVLREPKASQLGKQGAFEIWQLVIEAGLCVANPYACGVLDITAGTTTPAAAPAADTLGAVPAAKKTRKTAVVTSE